MTFKPVRLVAACISIKAIGTYLELGNILKIIKLTDMEEIEFLYAVIGRLDVLVFLALPDANGAIS